MFLPLVNSLPLTASIACQWTRTCACQSLKLYSNGHCMDRRPFWTCWTYSHGNKRNSCGYKNCRNCYNMTNIVKNQTKARQSTFFVHYFSAFHNHRDLNPCQQRLEITRCLPFRYHLCLIMIPFSDQMESVMSIQRR